ncbi:hypothetical protein MBLNU230_g8081t3 [Neophaeotheca triangularis]
MTKLTLLLTALYVSSTLASPWRGSRFFKREVDAPKGYGEEHGSHGPPAESYGGGTEDSGHYPTETIPGYGDQTTCEASTVYKYKKGATTTETVSLPGTTIYQTATPVVSVVTSEVIRDASTVTQEGSASTVTLGGETSYATQTVTEQGEGSTIVSVSTVTVDGGPVTACATTEVNEQTEFITRTAPGWNNTLTATRFVTVTQPGSTVVSHRTVTQDVTETEVSTAPGTTVTETSIDQQTLTETSVVSRPASTSTVYQTVTVSDVLTSTAVITEAPSTVTETIRTTIGPSTETETETIPASVITRHTTVTVPITTTTTVNL